MSIACREDATTIGPLPFGLMSLAEMINCQIFGLTEIIRWLATEEMVWRQRDSYSRAPGDIASIVEKATGLEMEPPLERIEGMRKWLEVIVSQIDRMEMQSANHRAERFMIRLRGAVSAGDLAAELRALREAIEGELRFKYFYHYPAREGQRLLDFEKAWGPVLANNKFPSCRADATAAVDCWALGHGTASVFHSMRVSERGLRAMARERKVKLPKDKPVEYGEWQEIIRALQAKADQLANRPAKHGKNRDDAVSFYRGLIGELQAFKDVYRNGVSHSRAEFDQPQAESVLNHVHGFMSRVADRLGENSTRQIAWGFR